jgi:hypothetical protein
VSRRLALGAGGLLVVCAIGVASAFLALQDEEKTSPRVTSSRPRPKLERVHDLAARVPRGDRIALRTRPGGRVLTHLGSKTEFGSPQTLAVAFRKGKWLAVRSPALGNEQLGWVDVRSARLRLLRRPVSLEVDLSRKELAVHRGEGVTRRISVAIGAPATPTPPGDFYVTDKLRGPEFGSYYGCCILALSGRQAKLPRGWSGGDRLAIHGAPTPTWGHAVSNGCLHADEPELRYLMRFVPLGTPLTIHA